MIIIKLHNRPYHKLKLNLCQLQTKLFYICLLIQLIKATKSNSNAINEYDNRNINKNNDVFIFDETLAHSNETYEDEDNYYANRSPSSLYDNLDDALYDSSSSNNVNCIKNICESGIFKWHKSKRKNLYVGGIFPMVGGWPGGQSGLPSAIMALNEVNLNPSILPNYRLNLNWFNSEVGLDKRFLISEL